MPPTLLVSYKGSGYSLPPQFINKRVKLIPIDNKLYIYYNDSLITVHHLSSLPFNYKKEHYHQALSSRISNKSAKDIDDFASDNLKLFEKYYK